MMCCYVTKLERRFRRLASALACSTAASTRIICEIVCAQQAHFLHNTQVHAQCQALLLRGGGPDEHYVLPFEHDTPELLAAAFFNIHFLCIFKHHVHILVKTLRISHHCSNRSSNRLAENEWSRGLSSRSSATVERYEQRRSHNDLPFKTHVFALHQPELHTSLLLQVPENQVLPSSHE